MSVRASLSSPFQKYIGRNKPAEISEKSPSSAYCLSSDVLACSARFSMVALNFLYLRRVQTREKQIGIVSATLRGR